MKKFQLLAVLLFSTPLLLADADLQTQVKSLEGEVAGLKKVIASLQQDFNDSKEAWFDLDEVFAKYLGYQDELDRIETDVKKKEAEFMQLRKEHDEAVAKLQNAGTSMTEDAKERTAERITEIRHKMETKQRMLEQKLQQERYAVQTKVMDEIYEAAGTVARADGWSKANPMVPKKLVFNHRTDITDKVISELNTSYKAKHKKATEAAKPAKQEPKAVAAEASIEASSDAKAA